MANIKHVNSVVDREFRNRINQLIDVVNSVGISIDELVVKGVMTTEQYTQLITAINGLVKIGEISKDTLSVELKNELEKINNKIDKGDVSVFDINKNLGKIDQTFLTDELLQQIAGSTPINAVPADNSIDTAKLIDGSVTKAKRTVGGESAYAMPASTGKTPNIDTIKKTITFYGTTFFYHSKGRVSVQADTSVEFPVSGSIVVAIDINSGGISARSGAEMFTLSESEVVLMHIVFTSTTQSNVKSVASNFDVTVNGKPIEKELITGSVTTEKLYDGAVTRNKRTANGETAFLMPSFTADLLNINTVERRFEISAPSFLYWRNRRHTIDSDLHLNWEEGGNQFLTFNTESRTFNSYAGGNHPWIDENDILIAHVVFTSVSQKDVKTAKAITDFTVNGFDYYNKLKGITDDAPTDKGYRFYPANIPEWYEPSEEYMYNDFEGAPTDIENYYTLLNALVDNNSDYITRENVGKDESGLYDTFQLTLKTPQVELAGLDRTKPKILVAAGLHGGEITSVISLYYLIKDLCENWKNNDALEYLRHNIELVVIPCVNPWGFQNNSYTNFNGVNINRNFEAYHRVGEEGTSQYGGTEPFSEIETRYVKNMIDNNTDAIAFIDYHTMGGQGSGYELVWHSLTGGERRLDALDLAACYHVEKFSREMIKRYDQPESVGLFGFTSASTGSAFAKIYANDQGVPGATFESFRKFPTDATLYTPMALKACTELIGSWLLTILKQFK